MTVQMNTNYIKAIVRLSPYYVQNHTHEKVDEKFYFGYYIRIQLYADNNG